MLLWAVFFAVLASASPPAYRIAGVPYVRQETEWGCGDASLAMATAFARPGGVSPSQRWLAGVARSNPGMGTLSLDVWRAPMFSALSVPPGRAYGAGQAPPPLQSRADAAVPLLGLPAGWRDAGAMETPWLDGLKALVSADVPVMVLQHYDPTAIEAGDGHFRVVVGYNESHVIMHDPWGRDQQPHVLALTWPLFVVAWNYSEPLSPRADRSYFGAATWPLQLEGAFEASTQRLQAKLVYPGAAAGLTGMASVCGGVRVTLQFASSSSLTVDGPEEPEVVIDSSESTSSFVAVRGTFGPGDYSGPFGWTLRRTPVWAGARNRTVVIVASGIMCEALTVPASPWNASVSLAGYSFQDMLGVSRTVTFEF